MKLYIYQRLADSGDLEECFSTDYNTCYQFALKDIAKINGDSRLDGRELSNWNLAEAIQFIYADALQLWRFETIELAVKEE